MKLTSDDDKKAIAERASTPSTYRGNIVTNAHSNADINAHALASIPSRGATDWIINSGASRHVTGAHYEFHTYTHLDTFESIQTADGNAQPVVGKDTIKCTKSMTLSNVACPIFFDIPEVIFQEKGTSRKLRTGTWRSGLWYLNREGMDTALVSMVDRVMATGCGRSLDRVAVTSSTHGAFLFLVL